MQRKADQLRAEIASISELLKAGRLDRALKRATKAAKKWPKAAALPRLAALCAVQQQNFKQAQIHFERAWQLDPGNAELIQNYALSLVQGGDPAAALKFLDKINARGPLNPAQKFIRALALLQEQEPEQALAIVDQVLKLEPANLNAQILKADCLNEMHQWDSAVDVLKATVRKNPRFLPGLLHLARAQIGLGQLGDVLKNVRAALAIAPGHPEALEIITGLPNLTFEDIAVLKPQVSGSLERGTANPQDAVKLQYAAANLARRDKNTPLEMQHLAEAHKLQRAGFEDWEAQSEQDCAKRLAAPLPVAESVLPDRARPIFVVGLPRSGTTLVERILARHSRVQGLGELATVHQWARKAEAQSPDWRADHKLADFYLKKLPTVPEDAVAFVDKAPGNYAFLGDIAQAFPNAVILNVLRDPRDVALSMWRANFGAGGLYYTHDLKWMAAEANRYQRYMRHWHAVLPGRVHDIHYETLVSNLQDIVQDIAGICDLPFEDAMLSPDKSANAIRTASNLQARKPVNTASVGGWQAAADQLKPFVQSLDADLWPDLRD
ncbi:tetratricopeptide repeat-containing sulfotransferase family protein [Ruegeria atlantica]|uniref:tetratricopeptide repeat-containing sulfotransferase family protein n=1 Tax=Ruegeria atlantica TaxID=81569 RepID=UPI00147A8C24|nr:sulfotransferase [Ruegeria atlantica]